MDSSLIKKTDHSRIILLAKYIILSFLFFAFVGCPYEGDIFYQNENVIGLGQTPFEIITQNVQSNSDAYITMANENSVLIDRYYNNNFTIPVGRYPVGIALWQAGQRLYVINNTGLSISVLSIAQELNGSQVIASISDPAFHHMGDAIVTADGRYLYVATDANAISVISTTTDKVVTTFTDPSFNYPAHLVADTLGRYIFVSESKGNAVSVISATTNTVIKTLGVGISPNGMTETTDGNWLFVVNSGSNSISVIDVDALTIVRNVTDPGFDNPQRIVLDPVCAYALVSNYNTGNISYVSENALINGTGQVVAGDTPVGNNPYDLGIIPSGYTMNAVPGTNFTNTSGTAYIVVGLQGDRAIAYVNLGRGNECN